MPKLFYLPLEAYKERYTWFMSCKDGWAEDNFKKFGVDFERIEGTSLGKEITTGVVLDAYGRSYYSHSQINKLILKIRAGEVKDGDVIYTEDFWTPGIESLFYIRQLTGIKFKIGCFFHAQSVDDTDFTASMKDWIKGIEKGYIMGYDYIFVCSPILKDLMRKYYTEEEEYLQNGAKEFEDKIHVVGLPFNSAKLKEQIKYKPKKKEPFVLFSSRFDKEKNPLFFLKLVRACPDIQFKLVKPRAKITNDPVVQEALIRTSIECFNLEIVDTSDKKTYYDLLNRAEVQFNCANQDWVSWTLLEAIAFGCKPLYPNWKDFPFELDSEKNECIYEKDNLDDCKSKLYQLFKTTLHATDRIVKKHDSSWESYLKIMGLI